MISFKEGDTVVYPGHGAAKISRIIKKDIAGIGHSFYELKFLRESAVILVATQNAKKVGLRHPSNKDVVKVVLKTISTSLKYEDHSVRSWSKRNKKYQGYIKSGSLFDIAQIYSDLGFVSKKRTLFFSEKRILNLVERLLSEEVSMSYEIEPAIALEEIRQLCYSYKDLAYFESKYQ